VPSLSGMIARLLVSVTMSLMRKPPWRRDLSE
jgi:hypothetical protein